MLAIETTFKMYESMRRLEFQGTRDVSSISRRERPYQYSCAALNLNSSSPINMWSPKCNRYRGLTHGKLFTLEYLRRNDRLAAIACTVNTAHEKSRQHTHLVMIYSWFPPVRYDARQFESCITRNAVAMPSRDSYCRTFFVVSGNFIVCMSGSEPYKSRVGA